MMVNSRAEFDSKKRFEAVRRLRYSHPSVIGRCRHTKEAWKESETKPTLNSPEEWFRIPTRSINSTSSHVRVNTRKTKLRDLFSDGHQRASSCGQPITLTNDFVNNNSNEQEICPLLKTTKFFPNLQQTKTIKPPSGVPPNSPRNKQEIAREMYCFTKEMPSYMNGWGKRNIPTDNKQQEEQKQFKLRIKTIEPIHKYTPSILLEQSTYGENSNECWSQEDSLSKPSSHLKSKDMKVVKSLRRVTMKFPNDS